MDLNQVTLSSRDVARGASFYRRLGLRQIVEDLPKYVRFEMPKGSSTLSLHYAELRNETEVVHGDVVLYFECETLDETVAELKASGIVFETEPTDQPWLWREASLRDPDGHEIRLYSAGQNRKNPPWRLPSAATLTIRPALPSEIAVLNSIDDEASTLLAQYGVAVELGPDHDFTRAELARWLRSAELGRAFLAVDDAGMSLGFAALDFVDGEPYLDQLSVRRAAMRRGVGRRLLEHSAEWARAAGGAAIWLTTYDHLPFNRPYYERHGYAVVPESACGAGIRRHLDEQRHCLPAPDRRVVMRRRI